MPKHTYREHVTYHYVEKTDRKGSVPEIVTRFGSPSTEQPFSPTSTTTNSSNFKMRNNLRPHSPRPSSMLAQPSDLPDEYNPYWYGLVPLSEKNIYRSFEIIRPETLATTTSTNTGDHNTSVKQTEQTSRQSSNTKRMSKEEFLTPNGTRQARDSPGPSGHHQDNGSLSNFYRNNSPSTSANNRLNARVHKSKSFNAARDRSRSEPRHCSSKPLIIPTVIEEYSLEVEPTPTTFTSCRCSEYVLNSYGERQIITKKTTDSEIDNNNNHNNNDQLQQSPPNVINERVIL